MGRGEREDLLDPVNVRREGRDDDAPRRAREWLGERSPDLHLRARVAGAVDVRRVGAEHEHALGAELGEPPVIGRLAVERARVELEVSGVHERADRRPDRQADGERADLDAVARPHRPEIGALGEPVLAEPFGDQGQRQRRAEDGHARLSEEVGHRADVVLVAVGQEDSAEPVPLGEGVGEVGDHVVDAGQLVGVGEHEATVDGDQIVAGLDEHHVEADLAESAEGDQPDGRLAQRRQGSSFRSSGSMVAPGRVVPKLQKAASASRRAMRAWV